MSLRWRVAALLLALAGAAAPASGQTAAAPAETAAPYGRRFAETCVACHGEGGRSTMELTPSLAGQPSFYAITQLFLYRGGRRDHAAMTAVASGFSNDDLRGFSDFIGSLPPPLPPTQPGSTERIARGQSLAQAHLCAGCHGADYAGGKQVPRLAHQREDYLAKALKEFRAGARLGYTNAMGEALAGLSAQQLEDLAHYLAYLP
jgi:cytochrome c553